MALRAFIVALFLVVAAPAQGMIPCFPPDGLKKMWKEYGEEQVATATLGKAGDGMLLLNNPKTGSWTMLIVRKDKMVCPLASGDDFKFLLPKVKGQEIRWTPNL
jgi:hypothetical protein